MTAETDLLPCPGCNGTNTRVIGGPGTRGGPKYWAGCDQCRWRTWGNTEAEAIAAWNRRAQAAEVESLRAEVERLNRILGRIVEGDGDSTVAIREGADAFAAAREYLLRDQEGGLSDD